MTSTSAAVGRGSEISEGAGRPAPSSQRSNDDAEPSAIVTDGCKILEIRYEPGSNQKRGSIHYADGDVYEGEIKNDKPHGRGICRDASSGHVWYDGQQKEGVLHGAGRITYLASGADSTEYSGEVYEGEFLRGKRHGWGKYTYASGEVYEGEWKKGKEHGKGTKTLSSGDIFEGNWADGKPLKNMKWVGEKLTVDTIQYDNGDVYEGQIKNGKKHGRGIGRYSTGDVYDGEWKDNKRHGTGTMTWTNGSVYEGEFKENKPHGQGAHKWADGDIYDGEWREGEKRGNGTMTWGASGNVYNGPFEENRPQGKGVFKWKSGDVYVGGFVKGLRHGRGVLMLKNGGAREGEWANGEPLVGNTHIAKRESDVCAVAIPSEEAAPRVGGRKQPEKTTRIYSRERQPRSQRSQQRRLQNNTAVKECEQCGVDDYHYKLRACSECNLALFCTPACQKAARRSHQRICDIISQLPPKDSDRLVLEFDRDKMADLDAGLRYATKYMHSLKHLAIDLKEMASGDTIKLSTKQLSSLLKSKKGALESVFLLQKSAKLYLPGISINGYDVWKELRGLKHLRLEYMKFDDVQPIQDIIDQQRNCLMVLSLRMLDIDWSKAKSRKSIAQAVGSCKHLVRLSLAGCVLMDADLKGMLQDLPNLRILNLARILVNAHEFTDNTCGLIARKCPSLQELSLAHHDQLSVRGVRKIFEGCPHLRAFYTTAHKLSCNDVTSLLDVAPQLMSLYLEDIISNDEASEIIEATGGRTVLQLSTGVFVPDNISTKTKFEYERQHDALRKIWSQRYDPEVTNEWSGMLDG